MNRGLRVFTYELISSQCIGQELDRLETVVFAASASSKTKDAKQKLTLKVGVMLLAPKLCGLLNIELISDFRSG